MVIPEQASCDPMNADMVRVRPAEDLRNRQGWCRLVHAEVLRQQAHEGGTARQAARARAERLIEILPFFPVGAGHDAWRSGSRPSSRARVMLPGPGQDSR